MKHQNEDESFTFTNKSTPPPRQVTHVTHTQLGSKEWTEPSLDAGNSAERRSERDTQARIQRPMRVRDHPWLAEMGLCRSRISDVEPVSCNSWTTATHDTRDEEIRAARDPMMVTNRWPRRLTFFLNSSCSFCYRIAFLEDWLTDWQYHIPDIILEFGG